MAGDRSWGKQFPFKQLLTGVEWLPCNTVQCTLEQLHSREGEGGGARPNSSALLEVQTKREFMGRRRRLSTGYAQTNPMRCVGGSRSRWWSGRGSRILEWGGNNTRKLVCLLSIRIEKTCRRRRRILDGYGKCLSYLCLCASSNLLLTHLCDKRSAKLA